MRAKWLWAGIVAAAAFAAGGAVKVEVDFTAQQGRIKPMHAVGQGPLQDWSDFSLYHYLREAHIPYVRYHDVGGPFGKMLYVDIPNLFRDFEADETDPKNYDFTFTDMLVKACLENGAKPFFRLGVTIENMSQIKKYRIFPPKDFDKWARICERVVAHYNEGWADGMHAGIEYWEVWNESDDRAKPEASFMWCGTMAEYHRLYEVTAKLLKSRYPKLKVGGYASCGYYAAKAGVPISESLPSDWKSDGERHDNFYFIKATLDFLDFVRDHNCPLDFFSFHSYDRAERVLEQIESISLEMKRRGIAPELILNEWLPEPSLERVFTPEQNTDIASVLIGAQHSDLAMLMLYDARIDNRNPYAPLFNPITAKPAGAYYALQYFGELYRREFEVKSALKGESDGLRICAAANGERGGAVMIVNSRTTGVELDFGALAGKFSFGSLTERDRVGTALFDLPKVLSAKSFALFVFGL